jgi:hypothetical protein
MNWLVDELAPVDPVNVCVVCVVQADPVEVVLVVVEVLVLVEEEEVVVVVVVVVPVVVEPLDVVLEVVVETQLQGYGWQAEASLFSGRYRQWEPGEPVLWSSASESPSHWPAPLKPGGASPKLCVTMGSAGVPAYDVRPEWREAMG